MTNEVTLTLTTEQLAKLTEISKTRDGKSQLELLTQVIDRGLYDIAYRSKRNKVQWAAYKEWKNSTKE